MSVSAVSAVEPSHSSSGPTLPPPKQIRFVASDGQPHTKRRRINAACLTCRKRKVRCSGERPLCSTCNDSGHVCAGYADRSQQKDDGKGEDDRDDDGDSGSSSPKRMKPDPTVKASNVAPKFEQIEPVSAKEYDRGKEAAHDIQSPASNYTVGSSSASISRNRVPYFRYFGPTAIVPGFKQMVVAVKDHRRSLPSASGDSPASLPPFDTPSLPGQRPSPAPPEIPFYDATDPAPNAPLITHLCDTFFSHLGCNYPFLQRERFMRDLEEKKVDAILVDAVCAAAARFSSDPILKYSIDDTIPREGDKSDVRRPFRGLPFAQRAMSAVIDTFPCPTIAVAQACLLLAYDEFGTDHDSGLWMYLGTAIRMAQDLGIQKLDGLQLEGRTGPTPKTAKNGEEGKKEEARREEQQMSLRSDVVKESELEDRRASEHERIDTFWAIFFLDRAVSSGVGRPVTLRDKDIEISFPYREEDMVNGYPHPFPPMLRIVHMYGRVADVLNNIKEVNQVTPEVLKKLASMEKDLTGIYQRLSPRLHFNATNFQHYVKADQGTNFILLHFWFHTLIVLLHQPTLLHSFEGKIQQLFPDSRELSMSSAKTIADIIAFAELIDIKSFIGNPFTSQPMYVAACAFLAEAAAHASQPASRSSSPPLSNGSGRPDTTSRDRAAAASAKHTLLASAANQNYQRCYKALKILDSYWAGTRYILTALDQKSKGLMSPLLYTSEDVDGPMPSTEPSFTTPGWRRSTSHAASMGASTLHKLRAMRGSQGDAWSPSANWNQAIAWSLSGTTNSPQPNLSFLYPNTGSESAEKATNQNDGHSQQLPKSRANNQSIRNSYLSTSQTPASTSTSSPSASMLPPRAPNRLTSATLPFDPVSAAEADLLLGMHSPYSVSSGSQPQVAPTSDPTHLVQNLEYTSSHPHPHNQPQSNQAFHPQLFTTQSQNNHLTPTMTNESNQSLNLDFSDMLIESQDVDMNGAPLNNLPFQFPGGDMIPWLEYLPQDVLSYFGDNGVGMPEDMMSTPGNGNIPGGAE
jgi:hypothetical protein